jgi:hypothetical protein
MPNFVINGIYNYVYDDSKTLGSTVLNGRIILKWDFQEIEWDLDWRYLAQGTDE